MDNFSAEAEALFTQMDADGTAPDSTRKGHIDDLIGALKTAGVWDKCDRIYVLAAHEESAALIDWKNPGTDTLTNTNAAAFVADEGFTSNGTSSYLLGATNYDAFTQYTQNSAHVAIWSRTAAQEATSKVAVGGLATPNLHLRPRSGADAASYRCNTASSASAAVTDGSGLFMVTRADATNLSLHRNGSSIDSEAIASAAPSATPLTICAGHSGAALEYSSRQIAFASVGASLASESSDLYDAVLAYLQAVGAA